MRGAELGARVSPAAVGVVRSTVGLQVSPGDVGVMVGDAVRVGAALGSGAGRGGGGGEEEGATVMVTLGAEVSAVGEVEEEEGEVGERDSSVVVKP